MFLIIQIRRIHIDIFSIKYLCFLSFRISISTNELKKFLIKKIQKMVLKLVMLFALLLTAQALINKDMSTGAKQYHISEDLHKYIIDKLNAAQETGYFNFEKNHKKYCEACNCVTTVFECNRLRKSISAKKNGHFIQSFMRYFKKIFM